LIFPPNGFEDAEIADLQEECLSEAQSERLALPANILKFIKGLTPINLSSITANNLPSHRLSIEESCVLTGLSGSLDMERVARPFIT